MLGGVGEAGEALVTGELHHHTTLDLTERGVYVALFDHTNTERGYLRAVAKGSHREDAAGRRRRRLDEGPRATRHGLKNGKEAGETGKGKCKGTNLSNRKNTKF